MIELLKKDRKANVIQACCIVMSATLLFLYLNFGVSWVDNNFLASILMALCYTFPLIFIAGLYGLRCAMLTYTLILIPTIILSPGDAFLLTFHLVLIYVVSFCASHGFMRSIGRTLVSGVASGFLLNSVFFLVNHLIAKGSFIEGFNDVDYIGMLDIVIQVMIGYLVLFFEFNYLPERITRRFPVGCFRNHEKNALFEEYKKSIPKKPMGKTLARILMGEAMVLGIFAAIVTNSLIPELGEVVEVHGTVNTGAVSGMGAGLYKPARKPDVTGSAAGAAMGTPSSGRQEPPGDAGLREQERADWYMSRTRLGALTDEEEGASFVLNEESIAFDLKLILFLLDIVMPIVTLIHFVMERHTVRPIADMAIAMGEFADDSIDRREAAAAKINEQSVTSEDEIKQLHQSLTHTVNEVIDYIQRLQEEQQLKEDLRVAQRASEAKSNFLSNVSHEIRTPINAVLGMDEMILRESKDPRIRKYATDIKNSGRTLVSLINDLLDFSRIEAGKLEILPVEYEMSSTLNDLVNMITIKADEKNLDFKVDVDERIPHLLIGDEIRVKQCIINILNNAVKYTESGSVTMRVGFEKEDEKHILLCVSVADTGIGMKEDDMKRLFTPFERIEENRNRTIEGAGLGMSIVKNLLDMMGSELEVESVYGQGSTFAFSIRQEVVSWEPMGDFAEMYQRSIESAKDYETTFQAPEAEVLVVDDTKMNLTVIQGLLEPTRVRISTAMSGHEAIDLVKKHHYDLIFLDQRMPGLDGIETLAAMKELPLPGIQGTPVVALTANAISGARERFIRAGFDDYLTKPIDSKKLESTMSSLLPQEKMIRPGEEGFLAMEMIMSGDVGSLDAAAAAGQEADLTPEDEFLRKFAEIEEIDYKAAVSNCLKEKILKEAVLDFTSAAKTGPDEIQRYLDAMDLRNYTVKVHALKSSARLIGAGAISEQAAVLEAFGDEENTAEILNLTPKLLADYRTLAEKLFILTAEPDAAEDDRPEIDVDGLKEAYNGIREYVDAFDFSSADAILEMLNGYRIPEAEKQTYERVRDMVMQLDHDGLMELLG